MTLFGQYREFIDRRRKSAPAARPRVLEALAAPPRDLVLEIDETALVGHERSFIGAYQGTALGFSPLVSRVGERLTQRQRPEVRDATNVAYKGAGPAVADVVGDHVDAMFTAPSQVAPLVKAGKLVPLAVTGSSRFSGLPDHVMVKQQSLLGPRGHRCKWLRSPGLTTPRKTS
jgi:hypothetical protein